MTNDYSIAQEKKLKVKPRESSLQLILSYSKSLYVKPNRNLDNNNVEVVLN